MILAGNISNVTLSKSAIEKTGLFNESMKISGDFDMWVRIARNYPIGFIKDHLIKLRDHTSQLSRQEKYYLNHMKEDHEVYAYLMSYIEGDERKRGKELLRNHKLLFYYTLMVKAFFKGSIKNGFAFYKSLRQFDNMSLLSFYFFRNRVFFRRKYSNMHIDNADLIIGNRAGDL